MSEKRDLAVYTSKQIIEEMMPILFVSHDEDGDWQFLSGFENDGADVRIVGMEEILRWDESLRGLSFLAPGMEASRETVTEEWIVSVGKGD
jgi:hypothetical protein